MNESSDHHLGEPLSDGDTETPQIAGDAPVLSEDSLPAQSVSMTAEQRDEAKRYNRLGLFTTLLDKLLDVTFLSVMALLIAMPLDNWLRSLDWLQNDYARLAVFYLISFALHVAISLPLSFYSGYTLEHRFGVSRQSLGGWVWKYVKRMLLALAFNLVMFVGLFWLIWTLGDWWWPVAACVAFIVSVVIGQLTPVLLIPMFYEVERFDDERLTGRLESLSTGTGVTLEGVYSLKLSAETVKANAMLAGLGRTRRVLLGDTLIDQFSEDEIAVVYAHELGHHVHGHLIKMIALGAAYSFAGFFICHQLLAGLIGPDFDPRQTPVYALPLLMLGLTLFSMLLEPLQNAISRRFERQADRYALERTGLKAAFVSAFEKLAVINKSDPDPHPLEVFLFDSHPPIAERIAAAKQ